MYWMESLLFMNYGPVKLEDDVLRIEEIKNNYFIRG